MKTSGDDQYASGIQHVTCPPSLEIRDLPAASPAPVSPAPQEVSAGASSPAAVPVLVTMDEAAKLIRVSKGTIRNRIRSGELPAKRLRGGQTVLIDQRDVLALLEDIPPGSAV